MEEILESANIFVTGGAGTLGKAIARRRKKDGWTGKLTVYSTDEHKHALMRKEFPDINYVCGDIRMGTTLYNAMVGHDVVIHAAACKVIPISEFDSIDTFDVNVNGSQNVCGCAVQAKIKHVIGISTDKACHPANAYGCTKMMMEKVFHEYSRFGFDTIFHLVRYGNVLESNGSVVEAWKRADALGEQIKITDPSMTRFWLSPSQAVQYVMDATHFGSGLTYIPAMPSLSIGKLAEYVLGHGWDKNMQIIHLRPGEKMHETLLTEEEGYYSFGCSGFYILSPTTSKRHKDGLDPYTSDHPTKELTEEELEELLKNV